MVRHIIVFVLNDILIILSSSMTWPPTSLPSSPIIQIFAIINNNIITIHVITIITNNIIISKIIPDEKVLQIFESDEFKKFRAKRELRVHKGKLVMTNKNMMVMTMVVMQGLGIMIIEGSHKATGTGIFVSDIQERSAAFHVSLSHTLSTVWLGLNLSTKIILCQCE